MTASQLMKIALLVLMGTLQMAQGQIFRTGPCPANLSVADNLELDKYLGLWYEYSKYPFFFELGGRCISAEYSQLTDNVISVYNSEISILTGAKVAVNGTAQVVGPGKLRVQFFNIPVSFASSNYWILGTDYNDYAVVFSCSDIFGLLHTEVVWILTRERSPSNETIAAAEAIITQNGLSLRPLERTDQNGCPSD